MTLGLRRVESLMLELKRDEARWGGNEMSCINL